MSKYYTLVERFNSKWHPQFGDFDRETVEDERRDMIDHGTPRIDLKIISSGSDQASIDAAIAQLNS